MNSYLSLDPESKKHITELSGKVVLLRMPSLHWQCFLIITEQNLQLCEKHAGNIDTEITASPLALIRASISNNKNPFAATEGLQLQGDLELAQDIKDLFCKIEIDWEEYIAKVTSDTIAHRIAQGIKDFTKWGHDTNETIKQNITEYLQEEARQIPPREEINDFLDAVDDLRDNVSRLDARFNVINADPENAT